MQKILCFLSLILLISTNLSGCISETSDTETIDLSINYQHTNGTIIESYDNGELISKSTVELNFNFSETASINKLVTYGIDTNDGREPIIIDPTFDSIISIEFSNHGIYHLDAFAIDKKDSRENKSIIVRIDHVIEWKESTTNNPKTLSIDPIPKNNGSHPYMIEVFSVVENPSIIDELGGGGQTVEFSWEIIDEANDVCHKKTSQVADGESDDWNIIHFNTHQTHELKIAYHDGQDYINIEQVVSIIHHSSESEPNI
jgi:hypothetical protein